MSLRDAIPGLELVVKHNLSPREAESFLLFFEGHITNSQLAKKLKTSDKNAHAIIMKLRLKGLVKIKSRKEDRTIVYGIK